MKVRSRYTMTSIAKVGSITLILCTFMLISVDLFMNLDSFVTREIAPSVMFKLSLLYAPEALLLALAPSLLFSTTYFLSQLHANNEMITLLNAGISYKRIIGPILIVGLLFSFLQFGFQEQVAIPWTRARSALQDEQFGLRSTSDNRNITLSDPRGEFIVHASHYIDGQKILRGVTLLLLDKEGKLTTRYDANEATWDSELEVWTLHNVIQYETVALAVQSSREKSVIVKQFTLEPAYFKNISSDMKTMELAQALSYVRTIKEVQAKLWHELATDLSNRILSCLTPFILIFIACMIRFNFKKNILLFSIIYSLSIAVLYYVVQMVTLIMAKQGVIAPLWGMVIPMIVVLCIAITERLIFH